MGRRMQKRAALLICGGLLLLFLLSKVFWKEPTDWVFEEVRSGVGAALGGADRVSEDEPHESHTRWIVVTTVQRPTPALQELARLPGWKMVVVGDRKTPSAWSLPSVKYLDLALQQKLGYVITALLPYDNYARKMFGYLYAIQHGAEVIYEVDDDSLPSDDLHGFHLTSPVSALTACTSNLTYNPYVHFGQSTVWPRGYPLQHIGESTSRNYVLHHALNAPAIQQGAVNADPDVDALFRLTRKHSGVKMDINFDAHAPPVVLPYGTFAPLNSQNTLFRYKAFWALALPVTPSFRTCDIYRGYWAQRLLWLVGGQVGFYPPNVLHQRTEHEPIRDAQQETDLLRMGELLVLLRDWTCSRMHFFSCVSDLARHLVTAGFWQQRDVDLMEAWLQDLSALGYIPPTLKEVEPTACTPGTGDQKQQVTFYPVEQFTSLPHSSYNFLPHQVRTDRQLEQVIRSTCGGHPLPAMVLGTNVISRDTLLVVHFRSAPEALSVLEAWYRPHFANILYCMSAQHQRTIPKDLLHRWRASAVTVAAVRGPVGSASCLSAAARMGYNVSGFLFTPDVALLHPVRLRSHSAAHMWLSSSGPVEDPAVQAMCRAGNIRCVTLTHDIITTLSALIPRLDMGSKFKTKLKQCFNKIMGDQRLASPTFYLSDIVHYLPSRLSNLFTQVTDVYLSDPAVREYDIIAMLMLECIESSTEYLTTGLLDSRSSPDFTFPFFMSKMVQKQTEHVRFYCEEMMP